MHTASNCKTAAARLLVAVLAVALVFTMMPLTGGGFVRAAENDLQTQTPVLAVTGQGLIGGTAYTADNVSLEKSYSMEELKGKQDVSGQLYSGRKSKSPFGRLYILANGVSIPSLIGNPASLQDTVSIVSPQGYASTFSDAGTYVNDGTTELKQGLLSGRYYYEGFDPNKKTEVPAILSWAYTEVQGSGADAPETVPTSVTENGFLRLIVGQYDGENGGPDDMNFPLYNGKSSDPASRIYVGDPIEETALTIGTEEYTRADVLMMDYAENSYSYSTSSGDATDYVRGVPMSVLLDGYGDNDVVTFEAADGYAVAASNYTVKQLIDNDYMLAYEMGTNASDLTGIYETAKKDPTKFGFFRLYGTDENGKPAKLVNKITVTSASGIDFSKSPYKHITNGGQEGSSPYNIDAITGATLTVEGPGVKTSVPVSVRDLEGRDAGAVRANYTDKREGSDIERTYEGIDLYYILHNMTSGDNGIQMTDRAKKVQIKNRNRRTIAEFTVDQVEEAHETETPIIVAYGTSMTDGTNIRPFVFDNGSGADKTLGNEDGCIKLVYDKDSITDDTNADYTTFGNMAYIYVAEENAPGYKHDKDPYQSADISNYILTVTGDKIGREVNYTVSQLEGMVGYDSQGKPDNNGFGYRDEYSLANSTYWYVNEYEGVQLWKLLLKSGLDPALAEDDQTLVSSTATDGYAATDKFTVRQVADPDSFGFYEKNPEDKNDGTYEPNENIRQGDDVTTGDKLRTGYPVLVAYGVNGYPYVEKASQDGYLSGLQNDGGPLRIISGKKEYNHPNGSNQAKYLDKVLVGDDTYHYSTHKYHSDAVYNDMAEDSTLQVKILNGSDADAPELKNVTYKVGDIEELIYGGVLSRNQLAQAKIKTFYQLAKGSNSYSDLYEGINLNYFLKEVVEIPGYKGTITFSDGTNEVALSLEDVLAVNNGSNTETGMNGLSPILAYAKNGAPMVKDKNAAGYQKEIALAEGTDYANTITVKNDGGPLAVLMPHTDNSVSDQALTDVKSITINLSADKYAHTKAPYDTYKDDIVTIGGEGTRLGEEGKNFAVSELEGKQTIAFTGDYSILKSGDGQTPSQIRYRGINLYSLLTSSAVGLKSNADKVVVTTTDGDSKEFTLSQIRKSNYINSVTGADDLPVILAYGVGKAGEADKEDGLPLVAEETSEGYDPAFGNKGGPIRFVMGQTDAEDVNSGSNMKFVKSIEVTASEMTSWNHNSSEVYKQYRDETVQLLVTDKEGNELYNKEFTVGEIEDNTALVEREEANVVQNFTWEGINFWRWVKQEAGDVSGIDDPISVTVTAADNFSQEIRGKFGIDGLEKGILDGGNYVPIILAYGVGGYPLVIGDKSHANGEGYDATAGNNGGPLRLITHNSQGTSLTYVKKVSIVVGENDQPEETADFTVKGLAGGDVKMSIEDIQNLPDNRGKAEAQFTSKKNGTEKVKGAYLKYLLANQGVEVEDTEITLNTTDQYEQTEASYKGITLKDAISQNYFVAYQVWDEETETWTDIADSDNKDDPAAGNIATVRIYRNYNEALGNDPTTDWRNRCTNISGITLNIPEVTVFKEYDTTGGVRSTWMDEDGTLWVGTYGGGLYSKKAGDAGFGVMNTSSDPALMTDFTSAVAADEQGGIWVSQNASYTQPGNNQGVLYIQDGNIKQYKVETDPGTIPSNYVQAIKVDTDGKVWFGSFGGLTIYDPQADTWKTYDKANSDFPATSINTIALDGKGGAWLGFYPDGTGTEADPYTGGFCHIDKDGTVTEKNVVVGEMTQDGTTSKLAQAWVRSIAIDQKGTVWVVASGTNLTENEGGTIWKIKNGTGEPQKYTGDEVFRDYLDGSATTEVRVVAVDPEGSLWFGTSADGVLKVENPKPNDDGTFNVAAQYAKETGSWSAENKNNVYSIDFWNEGTAYVGSAGGVQVLGDEPEATDQKPVKGDSDADNCDIAFEGSALAADGYYTIKGLKNAEGLIRTDATFHWINSSGTPGETAVQGETIENIATNVLGLEEGMAIDKVIAVCSDGYQVTYTADQITREDLDGNKAMLIWKADGENCDLTVAVGQFAETDQNRKLWAGDVVKLIIEGTEEEVPVEPAGDADAESADLTITGDALARDGYFTIKGIKNADNIQKIDASFNWKNSSGTTGTAAVQGATLENIFNDVIGMKEGAEIDTIEAVSADGRSTTYTADQILEEDLQGNKAMFIWTEDGEKVTKTIVGQFEEGQVNKGMWAKDVVKIIVHAKQEIADEAVEEVIEAIEGLNDEITLDDAEAIAEAREAYEALTDAEKAEVPESVLDKLEAAEQKLDKVITEAYVEQVEEMAAEIDYSLYDATDKLNLWLAADRFKQEIAKAGSAAEAKAIYDEFQQKLANTQTADQKLIAKLNMGELNAKAVPASYNTINISWEGVAGAEVYEVARSESEDGEYETVKTTAQESYKDTVKVTGKTYYYKVRAVAYTGENVKVAGAFCDTLTAKTSMAKPVIKKVKAGKKKATITWKKVGGAQGYEIYRSTKKNGKYAKVKTINNASTVKTANTKLKKGKTYFYKIKAFNTVDGQKVYTGFSAVKKVKIRK